ncbi:MAG TPA: pentapeptide repeat-containing protein, partial [Chloroflexia bacterium]|nr:pentapeptide repeat-containing protein [Chloroflexia bacterium]
GRITRGYLLFIIAKNKGSQHLDLSGLDFSKINLSSDEIRAEMERSGSFYDSPPTWFSAATGGIKLSGARFNRAIFHDALLWRGDYTETSFCEAQLQKADLGHSCLTKANLRGADFSGADLSESDLQDADLTNTILVNADISDVDLSAVQSLDGVFLRGAKLHNTYIRRQQLWGGVGEERARDYYGAKEAYLSLKNNFLSLGRYDDASWAYFKERQMERRSHNPVRARRFYESTELVSRQIPGKKIHWLTLSFFFVRHAIKWLLDSFSEITCGYGERPLRVIFCALVVIGTFPLFFLWSQGLEVHTGRPRAYLDYLQFSLASFATMNLPDIVPKSDCAKLLTSIEAILGISTLALLMYSLGNRIGRT